MSGTGAPFEISQDVDGVYVYLSVFLPCDDIARLILLYAIIGICDYGRRTAVSGVYDFSEINFLVCRRFSSAPPFSIIFYLLVFTDSVLRQRNGNSQEISKSLELFHVPLGPFILIPYPATVIVR